MRNMVILSAHRKMGRRSVEIVKVSGQHHTLGNRYVHKIAECMFCKQDCCDVNFAG